MKLKPLFLIGALSCLFILPACSDDDNPGTTNDNIIKFSGTMNGDNEVPSNASTATGNVKADFNDNTKKLTLTITYNGLSSDITAWHVHKEAVGVSGNPVPGLNYGDLGASPFTWTSSALDATMESDLKNNLYYVNIHTTNYPAGEIRAQLIKQ